MGGGPPPPFKKMSLSDFEKQVGESVEKYKNSRPIYEGFSNILEKIFCDVLERKGIKYHSVNNRTKTVSSFRRKALTRSEQNQESLKYTRPLVEITDLSGVRVIAFFPKIVKQVCDLIEKEFEIIEKLDKNEELYKQEKFGYQSIHFLIRLGESRTHLPEYERFKGLVAEIQVRTILQHAWDEIEHDMQYKTPAVLPSDVRRRFTTLAGLLELADREFQAIHDEHEKIRIEARKSVTEGKLTNVEITPDSLKAYLQKIFGFSDQRAGMVTYNTIANIIKITGFKDLKELDEVIKPYYTNPGLINSDKWKSSNYFIKMELLLLASMGENYSNLHLLRKEKFFSEYVEQNKKILETAKVLIGNYSPSSKVE